MDERTGAGRRLVVVSALSVAFTFLALETIPPPETPTEMWAVLGSVFIWTTVVWDGRTRPGPRVLAHLTFQLGLFVVVAALFGWRLSDAAWMGVTNVAGGFGMALAYARLRRGAGWAPQTPSANLLLLALALGSGVVVALLGGFPYLEIGQLDRLTLWWVIRNVVYAYVGGVTFMGIFYGERRPGPHPAPRWAVVALVPLGAVCLWVTYLDPELPLTWFLLLPALVAGSILTPRGAAAYALFVAMGGALATLHPINQFGYDGFIPESVIIDLLITTSTFITIHLSILRAQRVRATEQLEDQRRAAQEQAVLLRTVFETVTDGLIVLDGERRVVLHNHAARHLLGRQIPTNRDLEWSGYFGLTSLDGAPVVDGELPGGSDPDRFLRHVVVDNEGSSRVLEVGAWPLPGGDHRMLMLLSDVTVERERLSELTGFAGVVAHDLRGPLASLHGWLELADDAADDGDPATAAEFISRARTSSDRMRQVIEDWLAYTVQRDGLLTTSRVDLAELLADLVATHDPAGAEPEPVFHLDVAHSVEADRVLTRQLLANLLGNAIKYTPVGQRPHVTVQSALDAEAGFVRVDVSDRGIGLPEGEEERVFEEFHRASAHADAYSGTGLGLSLCRRIVNRHGGSIRARNNPDGGATFSFTLPAAG